MLVHHVGFKFEVLFDIIVCKLGKRDACSSGLHVWPPAGFHVAWPPGVYQCGRQYTRSYQGFPISA